MSWDPPSRDDPVAFIPWWLELREEDSYLLLIAWSDDPYRKTTLQSYARKVGGRLLACQPHKTPRQFLQWLASESGLLPGPRTFADLYTALEQHFLAADHLLILDDAHELSVSDLDIVRDLHHSIDDRRRYDRDSGSSTTTFVLSSGSHELVKKLDRVPDFWAYCWEWCHVDVPFSKKQQAIHKQLSRVPASGS